MVQEPQDELGAATPPAPGQSDRTGDDASAPGAAQPGDYGADLLPHHAALLRDSGISPDVARARGYRSVSIKAELKRLGFSDSQRRVPALLIPIWGVTGDRTMYQIRPDEPRIVNGKAVKYETPRGSSMALDVPPGAREWVGDPNRPLFITEGARKADAAVSGLLCCIALLGVWSWRGGNGYGGKTALADWEQIALNGRTVYICFDSDVVTKPEVHAAMVRLKALLESRGAEVLLIYLPPGDGGVKVGLDDYLAADHSVEDLLALASPELRATAGDDERQASPAGPYRFHKGCTVWDKPQRDGGTLPVTLANFVAQITADIELDDGAETVRQYEISATVQGCSPKRIVVPAGGFAPMNWPAECLGARATVAAGMGSRDRLREAIQHLSSDVEGQRVYAHTGWRQIDDVWSYLHGGGAIQPDGLVAGIKVELGSGLDRFVLPPAPRDPTEALQSSMDLLKLAPLAITVPLLGSVYLAPLSEALASERPDLTLWFHGPSGAFKSELAALAQGHYGSFTRKTLPASFTSTANALERSLFTFKDALLVVDDYHPAADAREAAAMAQVASRLVRGVGNGAGRNRMRVDTRLRPQLPPRALPLATGERLPTGHSNLARMFPVPVPDGAVDRQMLSVAQQRRHVLPGAMAWYVSRLALRMEALHEQLPDRFRALREQAQHTSVHMREPGQVAHLYLGLETFLAVAVEAGALSASERDDLLGEAWGALMALAREQAGNLVEETPTRRFLALLADGFASRRAYLEAPNGSAPDEAATWGWSERDLERPVAGAVLLGVADGDWLLLFPEATYQFVCTAARAAGQVFPVELRTLLKSLDDERLIGIEPGSGRRTPNVAIAGRTRRVIKLQANAVTALLPSQDGELGELGENTPTRIPQHSPDSPNSPNTTDRTYGARDIGGDEIADTGAVGHLGQLGRSQEGESHEATERAVSAGGVGTSIAPTRPHYPCGGRSFWRDQYRIWHCATCQAAVRPEHVVERMEVEVPRDGDSQPAPCWKSELMCCHFEDDAPTLGQRGTHD